MILSESDTIHGRHLNLSLHAPLPAEAPSPWATFDLSGTLADVVKRAQAEVEKRKIEQALKEGGGDKGRAADLARRAVQKPAGEVERVRAYLAVTADLQRRDAKLCVDFDWPQSGQRREHKRLKHKTVVMYWS